MIGERFFRFLLHLYPRAFRERFGPDLVSFFREHRRHPRFAGRVGRLRFWIHTLGDLGRTSVTEWIDTLRHREGAAGRSADPPYEDRSMERTVADLRYAVRSLIRDPVFTAVSVITLGFGIGATTAVFTVVHGVLLAPLDFPEPDRLVRVYELERENSNARMVAYGNYADLRDGAQGFEELAIWRYLSHALTGVDRALQLRTRGVSANFARTLGAQPIRGRWISPEEERTGAPVVVLSYSLWRSAFGVSDDILFRTVHLDGGPFTVIGVMPPGFDFPFGADAWVPLAPVTDPSGLRGWHRHNMVGRLKPGVSPEDANRLMALIAQRLEEASPETNAGNYFEARPLLETMVAGIRPALRVLFGAVAILLLVACVNMTNLVHARSMTRERELAVRTALGASDSALRRMLLSESFVLALAGGALGILVAVGGVRVVVAMSAGSIPRADGIGINLVVFAFAAAVSVGAGLLVGLIPLLRRGSRRSASYAEALYSGKSTGSRRGVRNRRFLVTAELALALMLTVGAGLLVRSFSELVNVDPGVDAERLVAFNVRLPGSERYADREGVARFIETLAADVETVPGVERAASALTPPVDATGWFFSLAIRSRPTPEAERPPIGYNLVSSGYLETVGARLLEGRGFRAGELLPGERIGVINRAAAERFWPDESPLGALVLGDVDADTAWVRVIGVVENIRQSLTNPPHPEAYVLIGPDFVLSFALLVRSDRDPNAVAREVEAVIRRADPDIPVTDVGPFSDRLGNLTAAPRFSATLMSGFAGLALLLAFSGVYGVIAFSVAQRRREVAIRLAVGASPRRVLASVMGRATVLGMAAIAIGLVGSVMLSRLFTGLLFGVMPTDTVTLLSASAVIATATLAAAAVPAFAAIRVDPMNVLREE